MQSISTSTTVPRVTSAVRRKGVRFRPQRAITITLFLLPAAALFFSLPLPFSLLFSSLLLSFELFFL